MNALTYEVMKQRQGLLLQEDKDFGYWGVDFHAYSSRAKELGIFLDRRPVRSLPCIRFGPTALQCCPG